MSKKFNFLFVNKVVSEDYTNEIKTPKTERARDGLSNQGFVMKLTTKIAELNTQINLNKNEFEQALISKVASRLEDELINKRPLTSPILPRTPPSKLKKKYDRYKYVRPPSRKPGAWLKESNAEDLDKNKGFQKKLGVINTSFFRQHKPLMCAAFLNELVCKRLGIPAKSYTKEDLKRIKFFNPKNSRYDQSLNVHKTQGYILNVLGTIQNFKKQIYKKEIALLPQIEETIQKI